MVTLGHANRELFRRGPDETFQNLDDLHAHCRRQRAASTDVWQLPKTLVPQHRDNGLTLTLENGDAVGMNDWSFTQLCRISGINKETVNRFSAETAALAFRDTLPAAEKPMQLLTTDGTVRSIHGAAYTRLWNDELLDVVRDAAPDFQPPPTAFTGGTGLYCGEQDLFAFVIDPTGWIEIGGEAFAPGFFVWNSEVGRRSLGMQTFWFQRICRNHLIWNARDVFEFSRKHTANVRDGLVVMREAIQQLIARRDSRRDQFAELLRKAMSTRVGSDEAEVAKELAKHGIPQHYIRDALEIARAQGGFTIYALVDALTRLTQERLTYVGDRTELDTKIAQLFSLAVAA